MKREDFKKIIKLRSAWKITGGNYKLPNGDRLSSYIRDLVDSQMKIDNLLIARNGDLCFGTGGEWNESKKEFDDYTLQPAFAENETCTFDEMEYRLKKLVNEIIH